MTAPWSPSPPGSHADVCLELHGTADSIAVGLADRLPLRSIEPARRYSNYVPKSASQRRPALFETALVSPSR